MRTIAIIISAFFLLLATGCVPTQELEEQLLQRPDISLTWKGSTQVSYTPESYQLGYNGRRNEYRVHEDRLAAWFTVRCSAKPVSEGQMLTADVVWTGENDTKEFKGIGFKVIKTDENGMVWLWNSLNRIGIVIKNQ